MKGDVAKIPKFFHKRSSVICPYQQAHCIRLSYTARNLRTLQHEKKNIVPFADSSNLRQQQRQTYTSNVRKFIAIRCECQWTHVWLELAKET